MKFRTRMIVTTAAVALLAPPFLFAAEDSTDPPAKATAVDSAVTPDAVGNAEVPAALASGQSAAPAPSSGRTYRSYPRTELFLGYSYIRGVPTLSPGNRMDFLNGGSTSIAFNLNRTLGLVGDFGGYNATQVQFTGVGANPPRVAGASGTAFTFMAGPRLSFRHDRITPFLQVLFGGIHASQVTLSNCTGVLCTPLPTENAIAMTAGGGLDIRLGRHIALRAVQAEYLMTRFADLSTGYRDMQNDIRLSSGLVLRFGGRMPQPPVQLTCDVQPGSAFPGDPVMVMGSAMNLDPKKTAVYSWTSDAGPVMGSSSTANINTATLSAGTYTVKGHVTEGAKPGQMADCSAQFTLRAYDPPTIACSAEPSTVRSGDPSTIRALGISPQNRPLTYSYNATAGSIRGNGPTANLSTVGAEDSITVTCNVIDDKGQTASARTSVALLAPPLPPPPPPPPPSPVPLTSSLCTVNFDRDKTHPTRVDNEAKACLDDVALSLQRSSDARLALVGNNSGTNIGPGRDRIAAERAVNTKAYLVTEKGIDASRIMVYTGTADAKTVTTTLVPAGASSNNMNATPVDESKFAHRSGK